MCHRRGRISPAFVYHCVRQQLGGTEEIFLHHFTLRQRDGADPGRRPRTSTSAEPKRTVAKLTFFWVAFWNNGYLSSTAFPFVLTSFCRLVISEDRSQHFRFTKF